MLLLPLLIAAVAPPAPAQERPIDFGRDIIPLLTRYGCNAGGCHGKASGQNGFKLSLLGFDPDFDYRAIVNEARGRRLFPASPEQSLLLTKGAARVAHGGGRRILRGSEPYQVLLKWIKDGAKPSDPTSPALRRLEVVPSQLVLARHVKQQLSVLAHYEDGSVLDVTAKAQYQSNEAPIAGVDD